MEKRRAMPGAAWASASDAITKTFCASAQYANSSLLLTYVSAKDNEVGTWAIIDRALSEDRVVMVPIVIPGCRDMQWVQIHGRKELHPGRFGLLEPDAAKARPVDHSANTVCLVPGIAFTHSGARIGYGGGYYDRFLEHFSGVSIGLAFELQIAASLPQENHDRSVDFLITENDFYTCRCEA